MREKIMSNRQQALSFLREFTVLIVLSLLVFWMMSYLHQQVVAKFLALALVSFSVGKVYYLISKTFKKMELLTKDNHSFKHLMLLSIVVIVLINFSFALDYLCLSKIYSNAFTGVESSQSLVLHFFDFLYFSVVTFTSVGYGDIAPLARTAKLLTMLEMAVAFVTIVFIISRYTRKGKSKS